MQLPSSKVSVISVFSALSVILYVFESFLPRPIPWMRFGLGNIIVLLCLYLYGFRVSLVVTVLKSIIGGLLVGNLFTPSFVFSISGSVSSLLVMAAILVVLPKIFSPLGISLAGAVTHNLVQLTVASFLFIGKREIFSLAPLFIILSVVSGTLTGIITLLLLRRVYRIYRFSHR
jgi:heptaprenyl diphosphate synthase